LFEAKLPKFIA
jgi:hypothetical protein